MELYVLPVLAGVVGVTLWVRLNLFSVLMYGSQCMKDFMSLKKIIDNRFVVFYLCLPKINR